MIKVGITGGIGSGKSTICHFFRTLGIPVFEADTEAKKLINSSEAIKNQLIAEFGSDIYLPNQLIDRKKLAGLIFNSPTLLEKVNRIIHPEVRIYFNKWVELQKSPYIIHEAAIMFESGFYQMMDYTILVTAPEAERIARVMKRENSTEESVKARIEKQWTDEQKMELASFIVKNDNKELIVPKLIELDKRFRSHG
ncbi:dephospho-CoA kinase [Mangrovibacterium diazotrophicum]|uniref:Dephospho-CoA kinase n=1 Tax=Mangrovibacterium diazotrophicum TaxID=1261403 RepID=A0A419W2N0_9BACT|nr:dephospho-CoA kinase [Mangrovibacterium diazotrophicum]RKD89746.1 dephospho-CoA kinase [Mangrovibacterium diazotrophicum]